MPTKSLDFATPGIDDANARFAAPYFTLPSAAHPLNCVQIIDRRATACNSVSRVCAWPLQLQASSSEEFLKGVYVADDFSNYWRRACVILPVSACVILCGVACVILCGVLV